MPAVKPVAGTDTLASQSAGFAAWLVSNVSMNTSATATPGANGGFASSTSLVAARTDASVTRQFQESHINDVMELAFGNGARPSLMQLPPGLKTRFSAFTGIADLRKDVGNSEATIVGGADAYISNFGKLTVIPSPFMRSIDVVLYDPKKVKLAVARPMQSHPLATAGDTEKWQVLTEYTLHVDNEKAHALITDVQKAST